MDEKWISEYIIDSIVGMFKKHRLLQHIIKKQFKKEVYNHG